MHPSLVGHNAPSNDAERRHRMFTLTSDIYELSRKRSYVGNAAKQLLAYTAYVEANRNALHMRYRTIMAALGHVPVPPGHIGHHDGTINGAVRSGNVWRIYTDEAQFVQMLKHEFFVQLGHMLLKAKRTDYSWSVGTARINVHISNTEYSISFDMKDYKDTFPPLKLHKLRGDF
jgi:hypothetical protein